jgi:uncharacterized membrane protein
MKRLFFAVPFLLAAAVFFRPAPAIAGLHICNKTSLTVDVTVATMTGDCMFVDCSERVWGWWTLQPGDCKTPIGANLDLRDTSYYYYAHDSAGGTWSGDVSFCIDPQYAFDYGDSQADSCSESSKRKFRDMHADRLDFTLDLTG